MKYSISGAGNIQAGEYDEISVSGSARLEGLIRCRSLGCSGAVTGAAGIEAAEDIRVSGSCKVQGPVSGREIRVSGALKIDESCTVTEALRISGGLSCDGGIRCGRLSASGSVKVEGGIEAEAVSASGIVNCKGLINAETVDIEYIHGMEIGAIGGGSIRIYRSKTGATAKRLPLLANLLKNAGSVVIKDSIEGDEVALEGVTAPVVRGRAVAIGPDCRIDLVQYGEQIEIDPSATVGKYEKV